MSGQHAPTITYPEPQKPEHNPHADWIGISKARCLVCAWEAGTATERGRTIPVQDWIHKVQDQLDTAKERVTALEEALRAAESEKETHQ